jgi:transposase
MTNNRTIPLGGILMIKKVEKDYDFFSKLFGGAEGKTNDFVPLVKFHLDNKLTHSVSVHQMLNTYPAEILEQLGVKEVPSERTLYRTLERVGKCFPVFLDRYQQFIKGNGLVDKNQILDFSSASLEGEKAELAEYGYSRAKRPDLKQINFGGSTGINSILTALTIQKGNFQDKKHMREMLKVIPEVIPENSLLIFDAGANTKRNKQKIRGLGYPPPHPQTEEGGNLQAVPQLLQRGVGERKC